MREYNGWRNILRASGINIEVYNKKTDSFYAIKILYSTNKEKRVSIYEWDGYKYIVSDE